MISKLSQNCNVSWKGSSLINQLVFFTMTLLVFSSIVIISIIAVTPIIMLAISELEAGQRDIIIHPRLNYLNSSQLNQVGSVISMPRHRTFVAINGATHAIAWFMDFQLENQLHLGTLPGQQTPNHNFIYAHQSTGLWQGQKVNLTILTNQLLSILKMTLQKGLPIDNKDAIVAEIDSLEEQHVRLRGQFQVKQVFDTAAGKFGIGKVNNYVYLDIRYAYQQMVNYTYLRQGLDPSSSALVKYLNSQFRMADFASQATVNLANRIQVYSNPDYDQTYTQLSGVGSNLLRRIGMMSVETQMPIANNLTQMGFIGMFIGVMFKLIIFSLFLLSTIMMDNMFRLGVEQKTFDFSLLKVMGASRTFVIVNILTGALKYVLVANLVAYPLSYLALSFISTVFQDFFGYRYNIVPTLEAILGSLFIGLLVPLVAAIAPIYGVIRNDLAEGLNPIRNKVQAIRVETYIEGRQFPYAKFIFGIIAGGFGLMIYYLLPRALINEDLGTLLIIFFVIIQGLMLGLILLSFSVQYLFERAVAYLCLFWVSGKDMLLTLKNLAGHRLRNRRTALLYSLSVAFIVFVSVGMQIQLQTMYIELLKLNGSFIVVTGDIDTKYYDKILPQIEGVEDWAYVSLYLRQCLQRKPGFKDVLISDKSRIQFVDNRIYAVSPNLINTFFYQKVSVVKTEAQTPYDPYSYLYNPQGLMTSTISKVTAQQFGILQGSKQQFYVNIYYDNSLKRIPLRYTSVFQKRMGLLYSYIVLNPQIGVSFDTFRQLAEIPAHQDIPIGQVKVKVTDPDKVKQVADHIRSLNDGRDQVWDYTQLKQTLDKIDGILTAVTNILLAIVLTISFFSLLTTSYLNVMGQTNEIATLLILGYSKAGIRRIYIYQNLVLVLSSCLLGLGVGYLVAYVMTLQRQIFSELPIQVELRGIPLLLLMALLSSWLSTLQPLRHLFKRTLSQILNYSQ